MKACDIPVGETVNWKIGLITREVHRKNENTFTIDDTRGTWLTATVTLETMQDLFDGKKSLLDLDWK